MAFPRYWFAAALLFLTVAHPLRAQAPAARFDLTGPKIEVRVTRAGKTLPIAAVPNLEPGDKLWLHPDLPPTQSVKYLLIAAFLRGTTNPPPDDWFTRIETWKKEVRQEGVFVTVPAEAQQAILFLAPETGGDFSTLRSAVRGRPGVFVRASQDLAEAGFEQSRIEHYVSAMKQVPPGDPKALAEHSTLLARTLNLRPNPDCFKQPVDLQYNCLTQSGNQTLLDDGHGQTLAAALANGPSSDLITQASYTQAFGGGMYSAYVGAIVDLFRLTASLHTAQYQYIPAIAFPDKEELNLRLNTAPSFHNPKSVIVIGLPAIQNAVAPPLRPSDPNFVTCLLKPSVVLPVEGAPLVFSTAFAHDLTLHLDGADPKTDLPLVPDAFQGGLMLAPAAARKSLPDAPADLPTSATAQATGSKPLSPPSAIPPGSVEVIGTINGFWGFDPYTGPTLRLQNTPGKDWKIAAAGNLIIGRENHLELASSGTACINTITLDSSGGQTEPKWKQSASPEHVDVTLALKSVDPGALHLFVKQFGDSAPASVSAESFLEPAKLTGLVLHSGDRIALLTGSSLNQVKQMTINSLIFTPSEPAAPLEVSLEANTVPLELNLASAIPTPKWQPGEHLSASVTLKDGRFLPLSVTVLPGRPAVTLIGRTITAPPHSAIQLANPDDLPLDATLTFSLKSAGNFPRTGKIEIASADDSLHDSLTVGSGLILQNPHTLLATLNPLKAFGTSAFGVLRLRAIAPDGTEGDWLPLATLVRLPTLTAVHCPVDTAKTCNLLGTDLYLLDSVASDAAFITSNTVPEGFVGASLPMPRPAGNTFYIRLRDDISASNPVMMQPIIDRSVPGTPAENTAHR